MTAGLSWLSGAPERGAWIGNSDSPRLRRPTVELPWRPSDGSGYVIRRQDADGTAVFFISSPPSWTTSWRAATRLEGRAEAAALTSPKTATTPAGPACEAGVTIVKLQHGFPG